MNHRTNRPESDLLTPAEVAQAFRVHPKTVTRWAKTGRLTSIRTPGNHRRYSRAEVNALRADSTQHATVGDLGHTVGVEPLTLELRRHRDRIQPAATRAVVERSGGTLVKVAATDVDATRFGVTLDAAAAGYARTYGATYVPAVSRG